MPVVRLWSAGTALLLLVQPAVAQPQEPATTTVQLQVHKTILPGGDSNAALVGIFNELRKDCVLVSKAFDRECAISNINIFANPGYGPMAGTGMMNGTVTIVLSPAVTGTGPVSPQPTQRAVPPPAAK
jgi:hypothetical protein